MIQVMVCYKSIFSFRIARNRPDIDKKQNQNSFPRLDYKTTKNSNKKYTHTIFNDWVETIQICCLCSDWKIVTEERNRKFTIGIQT